MEAIYLGDLAKLALTTFTVATTALKGSHTVRQTGLRTNILVCIGACLMMLL